MEKTFYIQDYCHIRKGTISRNGKTIFKSSDSDFKSVMKSAYKKLDMDYSKFFKMDNLSKLAFMAADLLLEKEGEKNMALIFSNSSASLDTDRKHQRSIQDTAQYYPSPAVFVYTLPNICMGEISIKHQLYSENSFFIFEAFSPHVPHDYANCLLTENKAEKALCGWVDMDHGKYDAFLYVVAKKGTFVHSIAEINRLYHTNEQFKTRIKGENY
ncbi:3-oxoacyl-ACP synthase [Maribacter sp. 2304DJ31-5]|uniref:3-oxoacyl-ACP synthase n=1 Tax=Maribacter sp. 2304DJ31-5 TaxID=3386273 RepID=UPI0039BCAE8F